jgi:hypothetical protein
MIKFFRKIRQNMIKENRVSKYLLYAIGEIVLVVIGILIALSINNWNENQKLKNEEIKILKVFRDAIAQDTTKLNQHRFWLDVVDYAIDEVKRELLEPEPSDSIGIYIARSLTHIEFKENKGPYEALKANGPNIITNDTLRNKLINLY